MKSVHGYDYLTKQLDIFGMSFETIRDLDESIDILCSHFGEDDQDLSLAEQHCPYFGVMWEAGIGLSQHLTTEMCNGKKILEIGCGLALPSFIATKLGGEVIATDFHADVPLFLELNQKNNDLFFEYKMMNWREEVMEVKNQLGTFDLVLGSDILYESQHPMQVAKALIAFLKPRGKIILADPGRAYMQKFVTSMNELNYKEELKTQTVEAKLTPKNIQRDVYIFEFNNE
jgi:predicted nicotinamide N-methyase